MMIIRYIEPKDVNDLYLLAQKAGFGLTSLQPNIEKLNARIQRACDTVAGKLDKADQVYLFVLEDTEINKVVGVCGIEVALGLKEPWYNFHVGTQVHASEPLSVYKALPTLYLSNDHTNCSELCTLFLDPDYRLNKNGKFLSKVRFLFLSAFRQYFEETIVAEMRGFSDENGCSPFWDAVGHKFFNIEFTKADYLSGVGQKAFIAELMPRHPLYVDMLPEAAKTVIGLVHPNTQPAYNLLLEEGLRYKGYVDIFDGGATLQADIENLRAIKESQSVTVQVEQPENIVLGDEPYIVANDDYENYRAILVYSRPDQNQLLITPEQAKQLNIQNNSLARMLNIKIKEASHVQS
ncbi:arginine N-succinyltransferase [Acinetobacter baumannii]|uniref:arginine N-succinyltransferase n=1 Tax=Acinetobacter calcoaceticus/baumannii complex TaxID=909768 RepID=UPI000BBC2675|nr:MULTISPECIES: arginine N-succinyltransferase [Acinetobacter calcoaceticus/baumannii complex]AXX52294.1 arginine N-succinyltransferase [Acinetobacter baumannii]EKW4080135.1 arginine N-succinyltransferase [Acinetobacter baumannii]MCY3199467.1 arginine N-succinyltransferase [Acinetobacter baumannii]MDV7377659.1 arginine N-succinyltransferase [Acinetobacter baumannii]PCE46577.1 arginine N-succinyltransferase [Acinetobacter baumannii]